MPNHHHPLPWLTRNRRLAAALAIGIALRYAMGLDPVWWMAWLAPVPLLALALRSSTVQARRTTVLAALVGASANLPYFLIVMPAHFAVLAMLGQAALWLVVVMQTRRLVLRHRAWWTVFAYPVLWTAIDTLLAALLPDGNWGGLGYTQAGFLPVLQLGALAGTAGLIFAMSLFASSMAFGIAFSPRGRAAGAIPHGWRAWALAPLVVLATLGYGVQRLKAPTNGHTVVYGLAAIDDPIGMRATPAYTAPIWQQYERHIEQLAAQGAQVILLPEKIALMAPNKAVEARRHFESVAARLHVWIAMGAATEDGATRLNLAWLLSPQGGIAADYQKHFLAPPERDFLPGSGYAQHTIAGVSHGIAICKDMHFATLGRAYGQRGAEAMLVPAWDFGIDGRLATAITLLRGVENGYTVVRNAREGELAVTDPYGRVLARRDSAFMPGSALLARVTVPPQVDTVYTRYGNVLGWLCVLLAALALVCPQLWAAWRASRMPVNCQRAEAGKKLR
jgi:apolipoprotein N-acyltransferase